jgi:cell division transport system permease protein
MAELEKPRPVKRTKTIYLSTIFSISLVLLMLGLLAMILLHASKISDHMKENILLNVIVNDGIREHDVLELQKQINTNPYVKNTQYVSKEVAAQNLTKDLGEDFVDFLGYNPLLPSIDVYMKAEYANTTVISRLRDDLQKNTMVKEVVYQPSLVDIVNKNIRIVGIVILAFAAILTVIAIALINNSIRLAIYSQRFLIKSMQLVGATKDFIRKPFLNYGILHGLLAGIFAIILVLVFYFLAQREVPELLALQNWFEFGMIFIGLIAMGILISGLSTWFAVNKYLKLKIYNLYR